MSTITQTAELPPEILQHISLYLSQHTRTVGVRVCKTWHQWITPTLWHTVDLTEPNKWSSVAFIRLKLLFGDLAGRGNSDTTTSKELTPGEAAAKKARQGFIRNLSHIRVLKIQYGEHWYLFFDPNKGSRQAYKLNLQELYVDLKGRRFIDTLNYLTQLLSQSSQLRKISIRSEDIHPAHQERLFAALPKSLENLTIIFQRNNRYGEELLEEDTEARLASMERMSRLPTSGDLDRLRALSIIGLRTNLDVLMALLKRCPALDELNMTGVAGAINDDRLAVVVFKGSVKGWKTLGFKDTSSAVGPLTVAAILHHAATLENLRVCSCVAFTSPLIQKLLCSAPKLKRFDMFPSYIIGEVETFVLMANDIIELGQQWACVELEMFKCMIAGVPRPDLKEKSNGRPLKDHPLHNPEQDSLERSDFVQKRVLAQLGRLTKLRELTLGLNVLKEDHIGDQELHRVERHLEGEYYDEYDVQLGKQYQCLTMALVDGLDLLKDLKCLQTLHLQKMSTRVDGEEENWMKENWPLYRKKYRDTFWASRGH